MNARVKKIIKASGKKSAYFVSNPSDVFYLSGFSGTYGKILVARGRAFFLTDARYRGEAERLRLKKTFSVIITKNFKAGLKKLLSGIKKVMMGKSTLLQEFLFIKSLKKEIIMDSALEAMRMIKDKQEIRLIKKAVSINENGIRHVVSILKPGLTERDIALEFEYWVRKHGAGSVSFPPIVAFDSNSAVPHHATSEAKLRKNTFILIDCGVKYMGYCSDLTRCICFGIIQPRLKDIQKHYNIVLGAKKTGVLEYINGNKLRKADAKARICLKKQGNFDRFFTHSLGHGMGIDVHEQPAVNAKEKAKFKPGMVFSCEPGIYMKGKYGIRIEDDYLVAKKDAIKLGSLSDGLIIKG